MAISSFSDVPPLAKRCLDFLEVDGVFRIENFSLQTPSLTEVNRLVKQFEDTDPASLNMAFENPDTVCGVLRKWLRQLPEPLFSYEFYDSWMSLQHTQVNEDLFGEIQTVLFQLHPTHYAVMQRLFRFLHKLSFYSAVNRLTTPVLGFHWQPCLIWSQANATALDPMRVAPDGAIAGSIVATMIEHYDKLFVEETTWVPPEFDTPAPANPSSAAASAASTPHATPLAIHALNGHNSLNGSSSSLPPFSGSPAPTASSVHTDPVGVSTSSASISHSEEDENSSSQASSTQASIGNGANGASATAIMANPESGHVATAAGSSAPMPIAQPSSSPSAISYVAHYQQQTSQHSTPQGSPQVAHTLAGGIPTTGSGSPTNQLAPNSGSSAPAPASGSLPPITIPTYGGGGHGVANSVPVTPITPLPSVSPPQPLARSFAGAHSSSGGGSSANLLSSSPGASPSPLALNRAPSSAKLGEDTSSSPRASTNLSSATPITARKKQPVVVNGYTQGTAICEFTDMSDGMLQFFKNEHIYITQKHDDGWWEGWKRGRRGFFPAQYVVEIAL